MPALPHPTKPKNAGFILLFFWVFLFHILLSYSSIPFNIKLWLFLVGGGTALVYWKARFSLEPTPLLASPLCSSLTLPRWFGWLAVGGGLALRLLEPVGFLKWPLYDEMINGYYAMRLNQHWNWHPFFFWTQLPPLHIWMLAFLFKILPSTLAAIRILPVLISLAILPLAYHSIRRFYSQSTSILFLAFVSTGFGFLYFGRICHQGLLLLFFEFLAFDALGGFLKAETSRSRAFWLVVCGALVGVGFYTYFSWPVVGLAMALPVLVRIARSRPSREKPAELLFFGFPMLLILLPLLWAVWKNNFGSYYSFMLTFLRHDETLPGYLLRTGETLSGLFWGYPHPEFSYGPVWGGLLNPITGCLAILGFLWLSRRVPRDHFRWIGGASVLFLIPAFLSGPPLSEMRIIQFIPLAAFAAVQGLETLLEMIPSGRRLAGILVVLLVSTGLDGLHLLKARDYLNACFGFQKTEEYPVAFPLLEKEFRENGPGFILFNLNMSVFHDYSLRVASYPFNAADNPKWASSLPAWLGIVTNIHYQPFLEREFPQGQWYWLSRDVAPIRNNYNGGKMLGLIPITDQNRGRLKSWMEMNARLDSTLVRFTLVPPEPARVKAMDELDEMGPTLVQDRFLQSSYWDMVFGLHNFENMYGAPTPENTQKSIHAIQNALKYGYPTAYFYNELGTFFFLQKNYKKAREAFEDAVQAPLNLTPAKDNLEKLKKMEKENVSTPTKTIQNKH